MNIPKIAVVSFPSVKKLEPVTTEMAKSMEELLLGNSGSAEKKCKTLVANARHFNTIIEANNTVSRLIRETTLNGHNARNANLETAFNVVG